MHDLLRVSEILENSQHSVCFIADWDDDETVDEAQEAVHGGYREIGAGNLPRLRHISVDLFDVERAGLELFKRAFAPAWRCSPSVYLVNVAQIADTISNHEGVRRDEVFACATPNNSILFGFMAESSPILGEVMPYIDTMYRYRLAEDELKDMNFRSRDFLGRKAALFSNTSSPESQNFLSRFEPFSSREAVSKFNICRVDRRKAWFPDTFGGVQTNIKTGFDLPQALAAGLEFGAQAEISTDGISWQTVQFDRSCARLKRYELGLVVGSTHVEVLKSGELRKIEFLDLMVKGGKAAEWLNLKYGDLLRVRRNEGSSELTPHGS